MDAMTRRCPAKDCSDPLPKSGPNRLSRTRGAEGAASQQLSSIPDDFLDHLTNCSSCFVHYGHHLTRIRRMRLLISVAACIGFVSLIGIAGCFAPGLLHFVDQPPLAVERPLHRTDEITVLDLRNVSHARGGKQATPAASEHSPHRHGPQIYSPSAAEKATTRSARFARETSLWPQDKRQHSCASTICAWEST